MFARTYRLPFRLAGIPVELSPSFLLIFPLLVWLIGTRARLEAQHVAPQYAAGWMPYALGALCAAGLFIGVVLHEFAHAATARAHRVKVHNIVLWFLGGVAQFDELPRRRGVEALIAIAGPLASFAIAGACWMAMHLLAPLSGFATQFVLMYLFVMNLMLGAFNLVPALPLDGGRILRSLLAIRMGHVNATAVAVRVSQVLAITMGLFAIFTGQLFLLLVAFFVFQASRTELVSLVVEEKLRGVTVGELMNPDVKVVAVNVDAAELHRRIIAERHRVFPVIDGPNLVGIVSAEQIRRAHPQTPIRQIMSHDVPTIPQRATALDAMRAMNAQEHPLGRLVAVDDLGHMVGIISQKDVFNVLHLGMPTTPEYDGNDDDVVLLEPAAPTTTTTTIAPPAFRKRPGSMVSDRGWMKQQEPLPSETRLRRERYFDDERPSSNGNGHHW